MEFYLLDVKRTVKVNGIDVAFDYINTYYYAVEAVKEAIYLSTLDEVVQVSVHKWFIDENGEQDHCEGPDSIIYVYQRR